MAQYIEAEGQPTGTTDSTTYQFPDIASWLNGINLMRLKSTLEQLDFGSLDLLVTLDDSDMKELCDLIKGQTKFGLKDKAKFKSEVAKQREKYHQYLSSMNTTTSNKESAANTSLTSMIVTKEERDLLQQLNAAIKLQTERVDSFKAAGKAANAHKFTTMQSISTLCTRFEHVLTAAAGVAFRKYAKRNKQEISTSKEVLSKLLSLKKKCERGLSIHNNEQIDIENAIKDILQNTETDRQKLEDETKQYIEGDMIPSVENEIFRNVDAVKMMQHFATLCLTSLRLIAIRDIEGEKTRTSQKVLMILPHAVEYIGDIKNELKQRNVKIIKEMGTVSNKQAVIIFTHSVIERIGQEYDAAIHKVKYGAKREEKEKEKEPEKAILHPQMAIYHHFENYLQRCTHRARLWSIEIPDFASSVQRQWLCSSQFDIFCPSFLGEYASIYAPQTINGKLMRKYMKKNGEQNFKTTVNLGFIECFTEELLSKAVVKKKKKKSSQMIM